MTPVYKISDIHADGHNFSATITFDPSHPVFSGHFPGQPIVPGVILVEIAAAATGQVTGQDLSVREVSVIKFLQIIDPTVNPVVSIEGSIVYEETGLIKANLTFRNGEHIFTSVRGMRLKAKP